jgi:monoamine oxidase
LSRLDAATDFTSAGLCHMRRAREFDVIVIGGGVSGLAAAAELGRRGFSVALVEARERLGGRVFTLHPKGWGGPVELGAEFVHSGNAALWRRVKRQRLKCRLVPPRHWRFHDGAIEQIDDLATRIEEVTGRIQPRRMRGWSFADFMRGRTRSFSTRARELAAGFVEGFQAATPQTMSVTAIAGETLDDSEQFVLPDGYDHVVAGLVAELPRQRVTLLQRTVVSRVAWNQGKVRVRAGGRWLRARAVIVTIPLGVWRAKPGQRGAISFVPPLKAKQAIARRMGLGQVMRIAVRFDARRWRGLLPLALRRHDRRGFGFIHSRLDGVPVWWAMSHLPVLTGWAGGPAAARLAHRTKREILVVAITSLSRIFSVTKERLRACVSGFEMHNWSRDPFSRCAYSFTAAGQDKAAARFREPMQDTLFFAGEATADGEEVGTVHGALASGVRAAKETAAVLGANS